MKKRFNVEKLRKYGIIISVLITAVIVIGLSIIINEVFDYKIDDAMIGIAIAGFSLIYEINKAKKLNEADFLVQLNNNFISNDHYKNIYNLLSDYDFENEPEFHEEISNCDISNYLTLFETLYILLKRKVVDITLLDNLFSYRFFLVVHNPYIQRKKITISPKNFINIYKLERHWLKYRKKIGKDNYFLESYHLLYRTDFKKYLQIFNHNTQKQILKELTVKPLDNKLNYEFRPIMDQKYLPELMKLQEVAVNEANEVSLGMLRKNTKEMLSSCLKPPHETIGVFSNEKLIGFGILYDPTVDENESLKKELDLKSEKEIASIKDNKIMHIKLVIISPSHRGNHLQYHLNIALEQLAREKGKELLLTTVSPLNVASVKNTFKAGFTYKKTVKKYAGATRLIYAKKLNP